MARLFALLLALLPGAGWAQGCADWQGWPGVAMETQVHIVAIWRLDPGTYRGTLAARPGSIRLWRADGGRVALAVLRGQDGLEYVVPARGISAVFHGEGGEVPFRLGTIDPEGFPGRDALREAADLWCVMTPGAAALSPASLSGLAEDVAREGRGLAGLVPVESAPASLADLIEPPDPSPQACVLPEFLRVPLPGLTPDTGLAVVGRRNARASLPSMVYEPALGEPVDDGLSLTLATPPGGLEFLVVPAATVAGLLGRPRDLSAFGLDGASAEDPRLDILVIGSPALVAISGLEALDGLGPGLRPLWLPLTEAGLGETVEARDFAALVTAARARAAEPPPPLSQPGVLAGVLGRVTDHLLARSRVTGQVVLVLEAAQYPADTPARMQAAIARIGAEAPLLRFPVAGEPPRRWLYVLTPRFVQDFARGYLEGPVLTANPPAGAFAAEPDRATDPRRLLADPRELAGQIRANLAAWAEAGGEAEPDKALRVVALARAYDQLALLVPAGELPALLHAARQARAALAGKAADFTGVRMNPLALAGLTTDAEGVPLGASSPPERVAAQAARLATQPRAGMETRLDALIALLAGAERLAQPDCTHLLVPALTLISPEPPAVPDTAPVAAPAPPPEGPRPAPPSAETPPGAARNAPALRKDLP